MVQLILPVVKLTVTSAMIAGYEPAKPPIANPRPVTMLPPLRLDAESGFQFAACREHVQRLTRSPTPAFGSVVMCWSRNAIGSMFASKASMSIICSEANRDCGAPGAAYRFPSGTRCSRRPLARHAGFGILYVRRRAGRVRGARRRAERELDTGELSDSISGVEPCWKDGSGRRRCCCWRRDRR